MANNTPTLVSPGVQFTTVDLSTVTQAVGITTLGLAGETLKGPAFQPVFVRNTSEFATRFGSQSTEKFSNGVPKYELPYIANSFLQESGQLYVSRILGLSGYNAGKAWVLTTTGGVDPASLTITSGFTNTSNFTGNTFSDPIIQSKVSLFTNLPINTINSGITFSISTADTLTKVGSIFTATSMSFIVSSYNPLNGKGAISYSATTYSATTLSGFDNIPVALIRSRADYKDNVLTFKTNNLTVSGVSANNAFGDFSLQTDTDTLIVSLDSTKNNFIGKVLGYGSKDKNVDIFVEDIYTNSLSKLVASNKVFGLKPTLTTYTNFNNYKASFQTPETPFLVSELRGNKIEKLFKFISISDGNSANQEIKISIENVNFNTGEFDVIIRDFNDTDAFPFQLEAYRKCTMNPKLNSFVAKRIGTSDMEFTLYSKYVMVEMAATAPEDAIPAGFEGYVVKNYTDKLPFALYKRSYNATEKIKKAYLGISDITGIDQTLFNYTGLNVSTGTTWGFHMDSGVTGNFVTGKYQFRNESGVANTDYSTLNGRKFTLVPAGGFDGWDIYRNTRTNSDDFVSTSPKFSGFTLSLPSDYYAYLQGINTFANSSELYINLFATPGIDYNNQTGLVNETIEMIEEVRGDCFYIATSPDQVSSDTAPQDEVDILDATRIDSVFTTTFFPWVQFNDTQNGSNIWLPPTFEYVRLAAKTDNEKAPWFSVAGYNRGQLKSVKAKMKINQTSADILYEGRINPIRSYPGSPLMIFGNKTLQIANTALSSSNVARLLLQLQKLVSNVAVRLVFEPNDDALETQFLTLVKPILATVKKQRGVIDFEVTCDGVLNTSETRDRLELVGSIIIKPTLAAEKILVKFGVTDQGATFTTTS